MLKSRKKLKNTVARKRYIQGMLNIYSVKFIVYSTNPSRIYYAYVRRSDA